MPNIELIKIEPNKLNPRIEFTSSGIDDLTNSIKQVGLLEPIVVRPKGDHFEVVIGERRYRASIQAGLKSIPVIIKEYSDTDVVAINLIENIQREDLSDVEKGNCTIDLMKNMPGIYPSVESVAKQIGVSPALVNQWIQTTKIPKEIQRLISPTEKKRELIKKGFISADTARTIQRQIKEPEKQIEVAQTFACRPTPVKQVRQIVKAIAREPEKSVDQVFHEIIDEAPIFLPFSKVHADAILKNSKTQTSRKTKEPRLQKGAIVRAQVTHFADLQITDIYRKKLGDFNDEDAKREGDYTLDEFKRVWVNLHGDWNPNESVYVIKFLPVKIIGESNNSV